MYHFSDIKPLDIHGANTGVYLVLVHPRQIPPHLFVAVFGKLYSLSVRGQHIAEDMDKYFVHWQRKKIEVIFAEIQASLPAEIIQQYASESVSKFETVGKNNATCLSPLKVFFEQIMGIPLNPIDFVFELLEELKQKGVVLNNYALNMDSKDFRMKGYTRDDINKAIAESMRVVPKV